MDKANPKDFLRALETARVSEIRIETDVVRRAIREAVATELEALARSHVEDIRANPFAYLLARAKEIRNGY